MVPFPPTCLKCGNGLEPQVLQEPFDFISRCRSYGIPSGLEVSQIQAFLSDVSTESERLDAEITRLDALVAGFLERRELLDDTKKKWQSLLAPVRKLPAEVLLTIFQLNAKITFTDTFRYKIPAIAFGGVCSSWRELAWFDKQIFSNISIRSSAVPPSKVAKFLSWSDPTLLTLTFDLSEMALYGPDPYAIFETLTKQSVRWKSVKLHLGIWCMSNPKSISVIRGHLPNLESISLEVIYLSSNYSDFPEEVASAFESAPKLRKVYLKHLSPSAVKMPWAQLTSLTCEFSKVHDILDVVQKAFSLRHLTIFSLFYDEDTEISPVTSLSLSSLRLRDSVLRRGSDERFRKLMQNLTLPALSSLSFVDVNIDTDSFVRFVTRSACVVRTLSLDRVGLKSDTFPIFFRPLIELDHLVFHRVTEQRRAAAENPDSPSSRDPDSLFRSMTVPGHPSGGGTPAHPLILPNLTSLDLLIKAAGSLEGFSEEVLIEMARSRFPKRSADVRRLRKLALRCGTLSREAEMSLMEIDVNVEVYRVEQEHDILERMDDMTHLALSLSMKNFM